MRKAPNEKLIETLFNYNALRFLEREGVTLYTPSTREEFASGYDAKLMGVSGFDELYVQFKTPYLLENDGRSVPTTPHQHARLLHYPPNAAYYVTHTFEGIDQIQELQRTRTSPVEFLHRYFAIEANHFEEDVTRLRYYVYNPEHPEEIRYKRRVDPGRNPARPVDDNDWLNGEELLSRFARGEIGARVQLVVLDDVDGFSATEANQSTLTAKRRSELWVMSPDQALKIGPGDDEEGRWGEFFRRNFQ